MVSSLVEGDTGHLACVGGTKNSVLVNQKVVAGRQPVGPFVGLGPPTMGGSCGCRVKLGFGGVFSVGLAEVPSQSKKKNVGEVFPHQQSF